MHTPVLTVVTVVSFMIVFQLHSDVECSSLTKENRVKHNRLRRSITRFHDMLILQPKNSTSRARPSNKPRQSRQSEKIHHRKTKVLPADDSLHQRFFSERVEEQLGHAKINYRLRRNDPPILDLVSTNADENQYQGLPAPSPVYDAQQTYYAPLPGADTGGASRVANNLPPVNPYQPYSPTTTLDKQRVQDLQEVFRILARHDGPLLEQMQSLRDSIERFYGIFEFMGVAKMPEPQRDAAIRKILNRSMNIDAENAAKRAKRYRA